MKYVSFENQQSYNEDEFFMKEAYKEAVLALKADEIPIGAVVVLKGRIVGRGHNLTEHLHDVTAHAEMQALTAAANFLGSKYLKDCTLYVTLEPCLMCAGATYWTQISKIVYGAPDFKRGFLKVGKLALHPKTVLLGGVLQDDCSSIVRNFFLGKRKS